MQQQPPYYPPMPAQTMVREYKDTRAYQKEANKLGRQGWRVQNVVEGHPMGSVMKRWLKGELLFRNHMKRLIVTYTKSAITADRAVWCPCPSCAPHVFSSPRPFLLAVRASAARA